MAELGDAITNLVQPRAVPPRPQYGDSDWEPDRADDYSVPYP